MRLAPAPRDNMGEPAGRIDARLKVTGQAKYAADFALAGPAYAVLVTSTIARGSIEAIELAEARAVDGVLDIFSYKNCAGKLQKPELFSGNGLAATTILPLDSNKIWHDRQIVAMVVAETFEAAREAAYKVNVSYHSGRTSLGL
jgi:xanthine dehydrogenase YagR molybdenum-binding subunit